MLNLILAVLSSALVSIVMRLSRDRATGGYAMLAANYLACMCLSRLYMGGVAMPRGGELGAVAAMGCINGLMYLTGLALMRASIRRNGVVLSATFQRLGLLVPVTLSMAVFGERMGLQGSLGFLLALSAILLGNAGGGSAGGRGWLILLLLANGAGDAMSKLFEELGPAPYRDHFLLCTFGAAALISLGLAAYKKERIHATDALWGLLLGLPNYYSARFLLLSLRSLPAVAVYPTHSVAAIALITLAGVCLFKERPDRRQWAAIAITAAAVALLNS